MKTEGRLDQKTGPSYNETAWVNFFAKLPMPKKSFSAIRRSSDLRFSNVYGDGSRLPFPGAASRIPELPMGIQGYTGHGRICKDPMRHDVPLEPRPLSRAIPGYTGFLPNAASESMFGRTHGAVAYACSTHMH